MRVKLFPNFTRHHLITHTNLIDFIISIETEASLLALAKSIYYCKKKNRSQKASKCGTNIIQWFTRRYLSSCHICAQGEI